MSEISPTITAVSFVLVAILLVAWVLIPFILMDIRRELRRANDTLERQYVLQFQSARANAQQTIE